MEDNPRDNELIEDPDSSLFVAPLPSKKKAGRRRKTRRASRKRARRSTRKRI